MSSSPPKVIVSTLQGWAAPAETDVVSPKTLDKPLLLDGSDKMDDAVPSDKAAPLLLAEVGSQEEVDNSSSSSQRVGDSEDLLDEVAVEKIDPVFNQTPKEEFWNCVTHGAGAVLSVVGLGFMLWKSGDWHDIAASVLFGLSMVFLYTASALYHGVWAMKVKKRLRMFDHIGIYLLIAGSYAPFTLGPMRGVWGYTCLSLVLIFAVVGIAIKIFWLGAPGWLNVLVYLIMGWLVAAFVYPLYVNMEWGGLLLLLGGGLSYSFGTIFHLWESLPYAHCIWHMFVLGGTTCHFFSVYFYVLDRH